MLMMFAMLFTGTNVAMAGGYDEGSSYAEAYAEGGDATAYGGEGGKAKSKSDSSSNSNLNFNSEEKLQGVALAMPSATPRVFPEERKEDLWNAHTGSSFTGLWDLYRLRAKSSRMGGNGNFTIKGKRPNDLFFFPKHKKNPKQIIVDGVLSLEKLKNMGYVEYHTMNSKAKENDQVNKLALRTLIEATKWECHVTFVDRSNLKVIGKGVGLNAGGTGVKASGADATITGGAGAGLSYALWVGDPFCRVTILYLPPTKKEVKLTDGSTKTEMVTMTFNDQWTLIDEAITAEVKEAKELEAAKLAESAK